MRFLDGIASSMLAVGALTLIAGVLNL